jgi:hypothetical protein
MPDLKLVRIENGDSQKVFIDKINQNFNNILSFGGGPYGKLGPQGPQGPAGITGPIGSFGDPGIRGTVWNVGATQPSATGSIPGDYWLNVNSSNRIYTFTTNGWEITDSSISSQDLFRISGPLQTSSGLSSKYGYFITPTSPENYTIVLNDSTFNSVSSIYSYNPQYSKMVISINNVISPSKKLIEFGKTTNQSSSSLSSKNPNFYFLSPGTTAGQYGLGLRSPDGLEINLGSSNLNLNSRTSFVKFNTSGFNINLNSSLPLAVNSSSGNLYFSFGGTAYFYNTNFILDSSYYIPLYGSFFQTSATGPNAPLLIQTTNSQTSNVRHRSNIGSTRSSFLLRSTDVTDAASPQPIFNVFGSGDVFLNRSVNSFESSKTVTLSSTSNVDIGSTVPVYWVSILPSIALTAAASSSSAVLNNGIDVVIDPSLYGPSNNIGISLWTPSAFTYAVPPLNSNGGWLSLLNENECLTVRVRMSQQNRYFRFLGLSTGNQTSTPTGTYGAYAGNGQFVDLSGNSAYGATQVEFTIMNISNSSSTSSSRWFKVYYSAYGGNLGGNTFWYDTTKCGTLYTYNSTPF